MAKSVSRIKSIIQSLPSIQASFGHLPIQVKYINPQIQIWISRISISGRSQRVLNNLARTLFLLRRNKRMKKRALLLLIFQTLTNFLI